MAGGYAHTPDGLAGIIRILKDLQRQVSAMQGSSPLQSARIGKGGLTVFDPDDGSRMFFGSGEFRIWDDYNTNPDGFGRVYSDPSSGFNILRFYPPFTNGTGAENTFNLQGRSPGNPGHIWLYSDGIINLTTQDAAANPAGQIAISTPQLSLYNLPTTGSASNLRLDTIGGLWTVGYVTSSRRYKQDIEDVVINPAAVLQMQGRTWRDKSAVEVDPDTTERHVGFIAEELDDLGLGVFVDYDDEGRPDAIQYDRVSVALLELAKSQQAQIDALSARLDALESDR